MSGHKGSERMRVCPAPAAMAVDRAWLATAVSRSRIYLRKDQSEIKNFDPRLPCLCLRWSTPEACWDGIAIVFYSRNMVNE